MKCLADFSTGLYLYNKNFSLGFSALNILQSSFNGEVFTNSLNQSVSNSFGENIEIRHFYLTGSYRGNIIAKPGADYLKNQSNIAIRNVYLHFQKLRQNNRQ